MPAVRLGKWVVVAAVLAGVLTGLAGGVMAFDGLTLDRVWSMVPREWRLEAMARRIVAGRLNATDRVALLTLACIPMLALVDLVLWQRLRREIALIRAARDGSSRRPGRR